MLPIIRWTGVLWLALAAAAPARAQQRVGTTPAGAVDAQQQVADDDAALRPLEPDFALINLPTTLPLPRHAGDFHLTHRFNGNLRSGTFSDQASSLFGLDDGAVIGFEYRFGIARHVQAAAFRTNLDRTIQLSGKFDPLRQGPSSPVGVSAIVSIEGTNNFQEQHAPAIGASISRAFADRLQTYVVPLWVHNTAASSGVTRDTVIVGVAGQLRVLPTVYLTAEVTPRIGGYAPGDPEYGFGLAKRVGGHTFMLTFTNTTEGTTFAGLARGAAPGGLFLGFNLSRKFF